MGLGGDARMILAVQHDGIACIPSVIAGAGSALVDAHSLPTVPPANDMSVQEFVSRVAFAPVLKDVVQSNLDGIDEGIFASRDPAQYALAGCFSSMRCRKFRLKRAGPVRAWR